jgi:tRNA/tmRNA/rRNA uracil-C5-methylase (TrmA/RlmC/RlmD family)
MVPHAGPAELCQSWSASNTELSGAGGAAPVVVWGAAHLTERAGGLDFTVSPQSFRQTNPRQGEVLLRLISDAAGASLAFVARLEGDVFIRRV